MEFLNKKQKIIFIVIGMLMIVFIGYYLIKKQGNYKYNELETTITEDNIENPINLEENSDISVIVHITGEIKKEGIVEVKQGDRIVDVIERAGGVTKEADLSKVNLAYKVSDGQKIYIPSINEAEIETQEYITEEAGKDIIIEGQKNSTKKVNINSATQTELETLSGIGPSTALKIINYRNENGKFKSIEDIKSVPGIGDSKFENIKEYICLE